MEKFFTAVQNMFKIPELRKRILFTLGLLAVYRFGAHVTAPGINKASSNRFGAKSPERCLASSICSRAETSAQFRFSRSA